MSSPHHNDGSASATVLRGICHISLTLLGGWVELLGTPIASLFGLFGLKTPWDDHDPWIKPEKHCQDVRPWLSKDGILLVNVILCLAAAFLEGVTVVMLAFEDVQGFRRRLD
jgi:hypothetical protein